MTLALPSISAFWQNFRTRWYFKFTLPAKRSAKLAGVDLDISRLSSMMKNHILQGRYEYQERLLVCQCITPADVVLELGGAIGFIGLFCRKMIGVQYHLTVEANPFTIEMMRRNYELNSLAPQVVHAAAAAEDGEISLDVGGEFWENSILTESDATKRITVPSRSLHSLAAMLPQSPTALICDIEGAETTLDFTQLPESVSQIIMEIHPEIAGAEPTEAMLRQLHQLGFNTEAREENTLLLRR